MSVPTKVHVDRPHTPGCNHQLVLLGADFLRRHSGLSDIQYRDAIGRRHRHSWRIWVTLICNDIDCQAVVLVRADAIEQIATRALKRARS